MIQLRFPLSDVLALAEHAIAAPDHKPTYIDTVNKTTPKPALWLVGDEGLYLMSNGEPGQPHPDGGDRLLVVYADGYRTAMSKHDVDDEIGGDDFCEPLPLLGTEPDDAGLHGLLTDSAAAGLDLFVINLDPNEMTFYPSKAPEATR